MSHDEHNACDAREQVLIQRNKELVDTLKTIWNVLRLSSNLIIPDELTEQVEKVLQQSSKEPVKIVNDQAEMDEAMMEVKREFKRKSARSEHDAGNVILD